MSSTNVTKGHTPDTKKYLYFYETTARRSFGIWFMLVFCSLFMYLAFSVDPASNCSSDGQCYPGIVYIARGFVFLLVLLLVVVLFKNARQGSAIDSDEDVLLWWQNGFYNTRPGMKGRISGKDIKQIAVKKDQEGHYQVFIFDTMDWYHASFMTYMVRDVPEWLAIVTKHWPHIEITDGHALTMEQLLHFKA